jgi:hypothetical protein
MLQVKLPFNPYCIVTSAFRVTQKSQQEFELPQFAGMHHQIFPPFFPFPILWVGPFSVDMFVTEERDTAAAHSK